MGKHILEKLEKKAQAEQEAVFQKTVEVWGVHVTSQHRDQFLGPGKQGRGCHTLPISTQRVTQHRCSPPGAIPELFAKLGGTREAFPSHCSSLTG